MFLLKLKVNFELRRNETNALNKNAKDEERNGLRFSKLLHKKITM